MTYSSSQRLLTGEPAKHAAAAAAAARGGEQAKTEQQNTKHASIRGSRRYVLGRKECESMNRHAPALLP